MTTPSNFPDFHNAEYVALRSEILQIASQIDRLMFVSIAAAAAMAAWLTANGEETSSVFWLGPLIIFFIAYGFYYGKYHSMWLIGRYVKRLENTYRANGDLGWEHFLDQNRPNKKSLWTERFTWAFLFAASALFYVLKIWPQG